MKKSPSIPCSNYRRWLLTLLAAVVFCGLYSTSRADNAPLVTAQPNDAGRIRIKGDRMVAESQNEMVEFIGNVKATQGETTITSDRLKIYYRGNLTDGAQSAQTQDSIRKIVATGNVIIRSADRVAVTEQAEYHAEAGTIRLMGPNSKVTSGNSVVTGNNIIWNRETNTVSAESATAEKGTKKQVEAIFYSNDKGLDFSNDKSTESKPPQ